MPAIGGNPLNAWTGFIPISENKTVNDTYI